MSLSGTNTPDQTEPGIIVTKEYSIPSRVQE